MTVLRRPPLLLGSLLVALLSGCEDEEPPRAYPDAVMADLPLAYWRLQETSGTMAADASGLAHPGAYLLSPVLGTAVAPRLGTGVTLSATGDGVQIPFGAWMNPAAFSVEAWVRPSQVTYAEGILIVDKGASWGLVIRTDGRPMFARPGGGGGAIGATPLAVGQLYHLVGTFQAGSWRLYVNGVLAGEDVATGPPTATTNDMHLGRGLAPIRFEYVGALDEVAFYDRVLTPARVLAHYEAGR